MKLSVVYSFFNEAENIPELVRRTLATFDKIGLCKDECEIIFINDNSRDQSENLLREIMAKDSRVKLANTTRNFGNAACILAGFALSTGEFVAYLDSDLQDPPELIERMYQTAIAEKVDIIHTKRTKRLGEHPIKMALTKLGYAVLGYSMSVPLQSNVGDFKIVSRRVVDAVLKMHEPLPFIRGMIAYVGFKSKTLEYERDARFAGETNMPVYSTRVISNFINNALIGYSDLPVHIILWASGLGTVLSVLLAGHTLFAWIRGWTVPGSASVLLAVTVFSSLLLFSMGILGLYLASIKKAVLRRPMYLIDQTFGFHSERRGDGTANEESARGTYAS